MKTLKIRKETKLEKKFTILKTKELLQIRGGDNDGAPTQRDIEIG